MLVRGDQEDEDPSRSACDVAVLVEQVYGKCGKFIDPKLDGKNEACLMVGFTCFVGCVHKLRHNFSNILHFLSVNLSFFSWLSHKPHSKHPQQLSVNTKTVRTKHKSALELVSNETYKTPNIRTTRLLLKLHFKSHKMNVKIKVNLI